MFDDSQVRERLKFWAALPDRLARLANRIEAENQTRIYGAIHARIPMVTADEQRALQEENAKADERFWSRLRDMYAEKVEGEKGLLVSTERAIAASQASMAEADDKIAAVKERLERLCRGEAVAGGFGKPMTSAEMMKAIGWSESDMRRAALLAAIDDAGGWDTMMAEIHSRREASEKAAIRAVAKKLGLS